MFKHDEKCNIDSRNRACVHFACVPEALCVGAHCWVCSSAALLWWHHTNSVNIFDRWNVLHCCDMFIAFCLHLQIFFVLPLLHVKFVRLRRQFTQVWVVAPVAPGNKPSFETVCESGCWFVTCALRCKTLKVHDTCRLLGDCAKPLTACMPSAWWLCKLVTAQALCWFAKWLATVLISICCMARITLSRSGPQVHRMHYCSGLSLLEHSRKFAARRHLLRIRMHAVYTYIRHMAFWLVILWFRLGECREPCKWL